MRDIFILKDFIREEISDLKISISKPYNSSLFDDLSYKRDSVFVPSKTKSSIEDWAKKMMLL